MSHHNNDVCGKSALTYKDSAEGLAEAWVVRRQGAGLRTARYFSGWPEQWPSGARSLGEENLVQVFSHSYARLKPGRAGKKPVGWRKSPSPSTSSFFFPRRTPRLKAFFLFVAELLVDIWEQVSNKEKKTQKKRKSCLPEFYFKRQLSLFSLAGEGRMRAGGKKQSGLAAERFGLCRGLDIGGSKFPVQRR